MTLETVISFGVMRTQGKSVAVVSLIAVALQLAGCGGSTTLVSTPSAEATVTTQTASGQYESDDKDTKDESPELTIGTRARPAPIGSSAQINDSNGIPLWEVALLESNLNANDVIAKENMFNSPPPSGYQFASARFRVTYLGADKSTPGSTLSFAFVTSSGTTHEQYDISVVGPNQLVDVNDLYTGGTATANAYISIPIADSAKGTWRVSPFFLDTEFHFAAE